MTALTSLKSPTPSDKKAPSVAGHYSCIQGLN